MKNTRHGDNSESASPQLQRLSRWLKEWQLDRILRKELANDQEPQTRFSTLAAAGAGTPYGNAGKSTEIGEIRLLHPAGGGLDQRPVYIAVLEDRPDNTFLIAPFGRFAEPALPGEWLTGLKPVPLRVLCLWNSRGIAGAQLASMSWPAGRLTRSRIKEALEVYHHVRTGAPLISVPPDNVGPQLRHPLDPRHQYQLEETELLEASLAQSAPGSGNLVYETDDGEVRLAAEPTEPYGKESNRRRRKKPRK
jgi:hypothetical protein